jgi:hypothetical protein
VPESAAQPKEAAVASSEMMTTSSRAHWLIVMKSEYKSTLKTLSVQNFKFMRVYVHINSHKPKIIYGDKFT